MTHDDRQQLVTRLTTLTADRCIFVGGARLLSRAGAPAPLPALIAEIDATVLARTLVFDIDGIVLRMAVAGRRLQGLIDVTGGAPPSPNLTGQVLAQDDLATTQMLGTFLAALCKDARQVTVRAHPAAPLGSPSDAGIPATTLARLWQMAKHGRAQSVMAHFLAANSLAILDFIQITGGIITANQGDTAQLEPIWRDQLSAFQHRQKAIFPDQSGPLLVCLDTALAQDRAAAIAVTGDDVSIFAYHPAAISAILASWRSITA